MTLRIPPRVRDLPAASFEAVCWDFDGTLVDTEPLWQRAEQDLLAREGATMPPGFEATLVGMSLLDSARRLLALAPGSTLDPVTAVRQMVAHLERELCQGEVPWRPGALELLRDLRASGVPLALVSASWTSMLEAVTERLDGVFDVVVAGDDVTHGKPHPEPYLLACQKLGVQPSRAVAVEDSTPGATSAEAAGCLVVVVPNVQRPEPSPRRVLLPTLAGLDTAGLRRLWEQHA